MSTWTNCGGRGANHLKFHDHEPSDKGETKFEKTTPDASNRNKEGDMAESSRIAGRGTLSSEMPVLEPYYCSVDVISGQVEEDRVMPTLIAEVEMDESSSADESDSSQSDTDESDEMSLPAPSKPEQVLYEVEDLLDYRLTNRGPYYLVKWKGYNSKDNTWEHLRDVGRCWDKLKEFFLKRRHEFYEWAKKEEGAPSSTNKTPKCNFCVIPAEADFQSYVPGNFDRYEYEIIVPVDPRDRADILEEFLRHVEIREEDEKMILERYKSKIPKPRLTTENFSELVGKVLYRFCTPEEEDQVLDEVFRIKTVVQGKAMETDIKIWEKELNAVAMQMPEIKVENTVDLESPPIWFQYINQTIQSAELSDLPRFPVSGCSCTNSCQVSRTSCCSRMLSEVTYDRRKRLMLISGMPILECGDRCACEAICRNRVVQDGYSALAGSSFAIFRTRYKGWGVKTLKPIQKGTYVMSLVGELITAQEAARRASTENPLEGKYLFDLSLMDTNECAVDYTSKGNLSRFLNHSCSPNLQQNPVLFSSAKPFLPTIAFFARDDIEANTELTFSYMDIPDYRRNYASQLAQAKPPEGFYPCRCDSTNCVRYLKDF